MSQSASWLTIPLLVRELMDHYDSIGAVAATKSQSRRAFSEFTRRTGALTADDLDDDHIRQFDQLDGESDSGYWGLMRSLKGGCKHLFDRGLIPMVPNFPRIPQPAELVAARTTQAAAGHTAEEITLYFAYLRERSDDWEVARLEMLSALVLHGQLLPGSEAIRVMWDDLIGGTIVVPRRAAMNRSAAPKSVLISAPLQGHFDRWRPRCGSPHVIPNKSRTGFWNSGGPGAKPIDQVKAVGRAIGVTITLDSIYRYGLSHAVPTVLLPDLATLYAPASSVILTTTAAEAESPGPTLKPTSLGASIGSLDPGKLTQLMTRLLRESGSWEGCRLYTLAMTVLYTGWRKKTVIQLPVAAVDLRSGVISTPGSMLAAPIERDHARALKRWLDILSPYGSPDLFPGVEFRGPWIGGSPGKKAGDKLREAAIRADVGPLTFEDLTRYRRDNGGRVEMDSWFLTIKPPTFDGKEPARGRPGPPPRPDSMARRKAPRAIFGPSPSPSPKASLDQPDAQPHSLSGWDDWDEAICPMQISDGRKVTIFGRSKKPLSSPRDRTALKLFAEFIANYPRGFKLPYLEAKYGDPRGIMRRLRQTDEDYAAILRSPAKKGQGFYGIGRRMITEEYQPSTQTE